MKISHIFFDLHGTLVDGIKLHPCYAAQMGKILAERYGSTPELWAQSNRRIAQDWDSYYADLNFSGEEGVAHIYEGLFRTTRAMFRLTSTPEPPLDELTALSRELPGLVTQHCDGLYPEVRSIIMELYHRGYVMGITTHALSSQAKGTLQGGGILQYFEGPIIGTDTLEQYDKNQTYFYAAARMANVAPEQCMVIDDVPAYISAARRCRMKTAWINRRRKSTGAPRADYVLTGDLSGIMNLLPSIKGKN